MKMKILKSTILICLSVLICSCATEAKYVYKAPPSTGDGWRTAHISEVNMDGEKVADLIRDILDKPDYYNIHSVLIIKNGKLVLEEYFAGIDYEKGYVSASRDELHGVMSVTKSFASTLVGIAIDQGMIKGTDEYLVSFFPEYAKQLSGAAKSKIKLKHVLSMTAGFDWDETTYLYNDPRNPYWTILGSARDDIIGYILDRPVKNEPGSKFNYNGGLSLLLGKIVEKKSSLALKDFADKHLFQPLDVREYEWKCWDDACTVPRTDSGLFLRPRDMAKLGYVFMNKGNWNGRQIISARWIEEATQEHIKTYPAMLTGYGYQWWLYEFSLTDKNKKAFSAVGWGGQQIIVFPAFDLVVVFTAGNYSTPHREVVDRMYKNVNDYILPAILSGKKGDHRHH